MRCDHCKIDYPRSSSLGMELVQPFIAQRPPGDNIPRLCGICALTESNRIHGDNRSAFTGRIAEAVRQECLQYRVRIGSC